MRTRQNQNLSILVVEDDPDIAGLLRDVLGDGDAVESVGDVPAALARLEREPPDIILLDCLLPGGGAVDVLGRANTLRSAVVLMSGSPEILLRLGASGCPCLQKPFRIAALSEAIELALSRKEAGKSNWPEGLPPPIPRKT